MYFSLNSFCIVIIICTFLFQESVELLDLERKNAGNFIQTLISFLPTLLPLRSTLQVDEEIQRFSSSYCEG